MNKKIKTWLGVVIIIIVATTAGIFVWKIYSLNPISDSVSPVVVDQKNKNNNSNNAGIANPASVYCKENGGKLEIRTGENGGQIGYCKFSDGSECEEWKYQRGECKQGDSLNQVDTSDWQTYRNEELGFEFKYPKFLTPINKKSLDEKISLLIFLGGKDEYASISVELFGESLSQYKIVDNPGGVTYFFDDNSNEWYFSDGEERKSTKIAGYGPQKLDFSQEAYVYSSGDAGWVSKSIILPILDRKKVVKINIGNWVYGFSTGETNEYVDFNAIISTLKFTK